MITLFWGTHALPPYWEVLNQVGNSDLKTQKRLLKVALSLLKNARVLVLGDREFHSPKLAEKYLPNEAMLSSAHSHQNTVIHVLPDHTHLLKTCIA